MLGDALGCREVPLLRGPKPVPRPLPGTPEHRNRAGLSGNGAAPLHPVDILSQGTRQAAPFAIPWESKCGSVMLSKFMESAVHRKSKHLKGFRCHYTFGIGIVFRIESGRRGLVAGLDLNHRLPSRFDSA